MKKDLYDPEGMAFRKKATAWREGLIGVLFCLSIICVQGALAEHDRALDAVASQHEAQKLLQACLNGYPLALKDEGKVVGAVFCSASKEVKL